ncbi:MAG: peptidoglycan DD-metalloendopeptidase family protein [Bacillota bacterium]
MAERRININTELKGRGLQEFQQQFERIDKGIQQAGSRIERFGGSVDSILGRGRTTAKEFNQFKENARELVTFLNLTQRQIEKIGQATGSNVEAQLQRISDLQKRLKRELSDMQQVPGAPQGMMHGGHGEGGGGGFPGGLLAGAKRYGGLALGLVGGFHVLSGLQKGIGDATQHTIALGNLGKQIKDADQSYEAFHQNILKTGKDLGYSNDQIVSLTENFGRMTGRIGSNRLAGYLQTVQEYAKGTGQDVEGMGYRFSGVYRAGVIGGVGSQMSAKQFAGMIAEATAAGRMQGREAEVIDNLQALISTIEDQTLEAPNALALAGLQTSMYKTGDEVLRTKGLQMLNQVNSAIMSPGMGEAGELAMYRALNPTGQMNYFEYQYQKEQGITGFNPFTGKSNLQAIMEYSNKAFPDGKSGQLYMSNWLGMSMHQVEKLQDVFMKNGKFDTAKLGKLTSMVGGPQGLEGLSATAFPLLADLSAGVKTSDVAAQFRQLGGSIREGATKEELVQAIKEFAGNGPEDKNQQLMSSVDNLAMKIENLQKAYEGLAQKDLLAVIEKAKEIETEALELAKKIIDNFKDKGALPGAGASMGDLLGQVFNGKRDIWDLLIPGGVAYGGHKAYKIVKSLTGTVKQITGGLKKGTAAIETTGASEAAAASEAAVESVPIYGPTGKVISSVTKGAASDVAALEAGAGIARSGTLRGVLGKLGLPVAIGLSAYDVIKAPEGHKGEAVGKAGGGLLGAMGASALTGAAVGTIFPGIGNIVGLLIGLGAGAIGYWGGSKVGGAIGKQFDEPGTFNMSAVSPLGPISPFYTSKEESGIKEQSNYSAVPTQKFNGTLKEKNQAVKGLDEEMRRYQREYQMALKSGDQETAKLIKKNIDDVKAVRQMVETAVTQVPEDISAKQKQELQNSVADEKDKAAQLVVNYWQDLMQKVRVSIEGQLTQGTLSNVLPLENQPQESLKAGNYDPFSGKYKVTSPFGALRLTGRHKSVDFAIPSGTDLPSVGSGSVAKVGQSMIYGKYVQVKLDTGETVQYGHLSDIQAKEGQRVGAGQILGKSGTTGISTGPHLDLNIKDANGNVIDPQKWLENKRKNIEAPAYHEGKMTPQQIASATGIRVSFNPLTINLTYPNGQVQKTQVKPSGDAYQGVNNYATR